MRKFGEQQNNNQLGHAIDQKGRIMRIIAFGDIHMSLGNFENIPGIDTADLIIITGDLTNFGGPEDARKIVEAVRSTNPNLLALAGNLDQRDVNDYLTEAGINLHGQGRIINNIGIFGVGGSNYTPFKTPNEFSEEELSELLDSAYSQVREAPIQILVSHTPPIDTVTDRIASGMHVGSRSVRKFIEDTQPALCLTGHIHEARADDFIGTTQILNPGMIKEGYWIDITLENDTVTANLAP